MRIACILVPHLPVAVERLADPQLADRQVVVYERQATLDASPEVAGAQPQLSLRQARALYPNAVFLKADHARYRTAADAIVDAVEAISPLAEPAGPGIVHADVDGLHGHYADEFDLAGALANAVRDATGLLPSVGIASGKRIALIAAAASAPGDAGVVLPGREHEFVADHSIALLPFGAEVVQRLDLLALGTLGEVAALPKASVEAQFGGAGARIWELASGIDREPLRPRKRQESLHERLSFDAAVVANEALIMAGRQLVSRLARRLRGRAALRMHVQLLANERIVWEKLETFREPTGDEGRMTLLLKTRLSLLELPEPVDAVAIALTGIGREVAKQAKLFTDSRQHINQIGDAVRQLHARYGRPMVYRVAEVDPRSRHPEERTALIPYDA